MNILIFLADFSRVLLTAIDDNEITTYINAVHISVSYIYSLLHIILLSYMYNNGTSRSFDQNNQSQFCLTGMLIIC
jgi:hypothetical protein